MTNRLLSLMQLCDSNFPSGSFSHSFGLETYIQDEVIHNKETFFQWLRIYVEKQFVFTDGLACRFVFDALEKKEFEMLWKWDRLLYVQNVPEESREASRRIGERLVRIGIDLFQIPILEEYLRRIRLKEAAGHPAVVFPIISYHLGIEKKETVLSFLYSAMASLVQNGVRGIPLGQTDGQRILLELQPYLLRAAEKINVLAKDDFGTVVPGLEIAQMRHQQLQVRLFMS